MALAQALVDTTRTALKRGLVKGYMPREEQGHVVRGRWDIARQLTVRPGIPIPLELTFDEFTEDVPENRILHTAIRRIAKSEALSGQVAQDLDRLLPLFADVAVLTAGAIVPATRRTRLNAHYSPALAIARLILEASSWAHAEGRTRGRSFLVDMPRVFERFVGIALTSRLASQGLTVELQDSDWRLDRDRRVILRPDIVISRNGEPVTVADTKYKVWGASAGSPSNDNVYQALAYAIALGVPESHLIYVSGDIEPRSYPIPAAGKTVIAHAIGLGGSPQQLLRSVSDLGDVLVADRGSTLVG
jgi:5-methylcytosine-specific restriction enzyme subunit McrC